VKSEVIDRGGAHHPLLELARARMLEFVREPEAMFWTFVFPMIMSVGLAIAFPGGTAKPSVIGVEGGEGTASIRQALSRAAGVTVREVSKGERATSTSSSFPATRLRIATIRRATRAARRVRSSTMR
jgi:hypothetical protein